MNDHNLTLFEDGPLPTASPSKRRSDEDWSQRALDELFSLAKKYRTTKSYGELMRFLGHFRFYAPFNAMLVHVQMPGATYVAPAHRWLNDFKRVVTPDARPLVILQPMGPVMFVFDVADTEPLPDAEPLPDEVVNPFAVTSGKIGGALEQTIDNAKRDGVRIKLQHSGSQRAGVIRRSASQGFQLFQIGAKPKPKHVRVEIRYELLINSHLSREAKFATLAHELAHLYCGHLGSPNEKWWPDRQGLDITTVEFEAESVCYLVCARLGIDNPSQKYLAEFIGKNAEVPPVSLECILKAAGLIEQMGRSRMKPRPEIKI